MSARPKPETLAEARKADRIAAALRELASSHRQLELLREAQRNHVKTLRRAGVSWARIGTQLGVSGEAARQRFDK